MVWVMATLSSPAPNFSWNRNWHFRPSAFMKRVRMNLLVRHHVPADVKPAAFIIDLACIPLDELGGTTEAGFSRPPLFLPLTAGRYIYSAP